MKLKNPDKSVYVYQYRYIRFYLYETLEKTGQFYGDRKQMGSMRGKD